VDFLENVKGGLIVSCQARPGEPFYGSHFMAEFAKAAYLAGAKGIRANGTKDIKAIRQAVPLPVVGIEKRRTADYPVYITPTGEEATRVAKAGSAIVGIDGTRRPRPKDSTGRSWTLEDLVRYIREEIGLPVLADVSTFEEGAYAASLGVDCVATTLSGYTEYSPQIEGPDLDLVARLSRKAGVPVIAEGRYVTPDDVKRALDLGAWAVVVGRAITMPHFIAGRFARATQQ